MSAACKHWRYLGLLLAMPLVMQLAGCALSGNELPQTRSAADIVPPAAQTKAPPAKTTTQGNVAPTPAPVASKPVPATPTPTAKAAKNEAGANAVPAAASGVIPPAAQKQFDAALTQLKSGQVAAAQQQLQRMTRDYPDLAAPWINLGLLESKAGHQDAALNYFKEAVQHSPKSAPAQTYLGLAWRQAGKFKEAEAAYQAALAVDDSFALAHFNLGVLYDLYLQRPEPALQHYERYQSLQSAPDAKVASWIKDLKNRLGTKSKPEAQS